MATRKFALTSSNDISIEVKKNGGDSFELSVGPTIVELSWSQLEMFRLGAGDLSDWYLKQKEKDKEA